MPSCTLRSCLGYSWLPQPGQAAETSWSSSAIFITCVFRLWNGTPEYSWLMDPSRYNDADKLLAHPHEMNVRWIVKSSNYPTSLAPAFSALEREGTSRILPEPGESTDSAKKSRLSCGKFASENLRAGMALKSRRPALQRAFEGRKLQGHCAVGHRTLSSTAV